MQGIMRQECLQSYQTLSLTQNFQNQSLCLTSLALFKKDQGLVFGTITLLNSYLVLGFASQVLQNGHFLYQFWPDNQNLGFLTSHFVTFFGQPHILLFNLFLITLCKSWKSRDCLSLTLTLLEQRRPFGFVSPLFRSPHYPSYVRFTLVLLVLTYSTQHR